MRSYQQFFAEMKRRRVFRVMAAYGIIGFGIIEAAGEIFPRVGIPDWAVTLVVWLTLLGFPIAVVLAWAFESSPEGVKRTEDATPEEISEIIAQPAAKRWSSGLLALAGVALLFGGWWIGQRTAAEPGDVAQANLVSGLELVDLSDDARASIAVLPFADMSPEGDQEYYSDGMTEELLNVLAKIRELRVAARTSTFALKDQDLTAAQWGDTLGVAYLIEGSVRKAGDQVRITAQLIDTADGSHLWTDAYTRPLADIFAVQEEIAEAIAGALAVPLGLDEASDLVTPTADVEAYDLFLAGRSRLRARDEGTFDAIELFEAAVARDSNWAPAWAGLADALEISTWQDSLPYDSVLTYGTLARAEEAARRALELHPQNSTALIALGSIHRDRHQWAEAEGFYRQALDLDPDNAEAHQQYGEWLYKRGRIAEAVRSMDRASALDPAPIRIYQLAYALQLDGRQAEAADVYEWAEEQGLDQQYSVLAAWAERSPVERAWAEERYEDWLDLQIEATDDLQVADTVGAGAAFAALRAGSWDMMPDSLKEGMDYRSLIRLDQLDQAVDIFLQLIEPLRPHDPQYVWYPFMDPLHSHPRLQEHMESMDLVGLTAQRTPVEERVRPAILRRADAAAGRSGESVP